jgi:hypothetical protein
MGRHRPPSSTTSAVERPHDTLPRQDAPASVPANTKIPVRRGRLAAAAGFVLLAVVAVPGGPASQVLGPTGDPAVPSAVALDPASRGQLAADRETRPRPPVAGTTTGAAPSSTVSGTTAASGTTQDTAATAAGTATSSSSSSSAPSSPSSSSSTSASSSSSTSASSSSSTASSSAASSSSSAGAGTTTSSSSPTASSSASSAAAAGPSSSTSAAALPAGTTRGVLADLTQLTSTSTSTAAWKNVLSAAADHSGGVDLANQDNTHAARTLAAALVFARTGDAASRDQVVSALRQLPKAPLGSARVLSVARQLGGYAIAADLIDYRDASFQSWIGGMRTANIGNHGRWTAISQTSEDSPNNWGAWAMASRIAVSSYLGDKADLARAATVFRGFVGERSAYAGFRHTSDFDPSWGCGGDAWVPINPANCGGQSGAIVEDISRSAGAYPSVDTTGLTYSWEVLGGATLSSRLLARAGYTDVWQWGDRALLRAATFLQQHGGYTPAYRANQYIPYEINRAYGTQLGPLGAVGYGRQFGFTDWLR